MHIKHFSSFFLAKYFLKSGFFCNLTKLKKSSGARLECSGSNVSKADGSCPGHPRPTRWSWCSCIPPSPRWSLNKKTQHMEWGVGQMLIATRTGWVLLSPRTDCGDGGDDLPQLQLVEDGGLPGGVQAHHEDPHFFFAYQALQQVPKDVSHDASDLSCNRTVRQVTEQQSGCKYSHEGKKKEEKSDSYQHFSLSTLQDLALEAMTWYTF